jgi:hypothetical protein
VHNGLIKEQFNRWAILSNGYCIHLVPADNQLFANNFADIIRNIIFTLKADMGVNTIPEVFIDLFGT